MEFVLSKVGYPYSQAYRDSGDYYDRSSIAYYTWQNARVNIMYGDANTAASEGKYCYDNNLLVNYEEMQPGDLIFYSYGNNGRFMNITHAAVYVGNGKVVEALDCYLADPNFQYLLMNQGLLDKKEAEKICLYNVLGYVSGLARAIKDGDFIAMRRHAGTPEGYQEPFVQCVAKMMELISKKKTEPEQEKENVQLSLFQFGVEIGQCC